MTQLISAYFATNVFDLQSPTYDQLNKDNKFSDHNFVVFISVDVCLSSPCKNGTTCVVDRSGGYVCNCPLGYSGTDCKTEKQTGKKRTKQH